MAEALIEIAGVVKTYAALRPLRLVSLAVAGTDRLALFGFDASAAEMFTHLVTGAALPDQGHVRVAGRDTRDIATDTEWLASLDRFGIVTHRAVLLEGLSVAANLALPLTLAIDPMADDVRARVEQEAAGVGLDRATLERPVAALTEEERLRLHLARAVSVGPELLMLEHPTARLNDAGRSAAVGETLRTLADARGFGWIALTEDEPFAEAAGARRLTLTPATGTLAPPARGWRRWF